MNMETQIRQALARGYCSPENEQKVLDPDLIEAMTRELLELFTPGAGRSDTMECMTCHQTKHVNDFATPDYCNDCFKVD